MNKYRAWRILNTILIVAGMFGPWENLGKNGIDGIELLTQTAIPAIGILVENFSLETSLGTTWIVLPGTIFIIFACVYAVINFLDAVSDKLNLKTWRIRSLVLSLLGLCGVILSPIVLMLVGAGWGAILCAAAMLSALATELVISNAKKEIV